MLLICYFVGATLCALYVNMSLLFNVGKRRGVIKPLRLQRYNKKMTYANKRGFFCEKYETSGMTCRIMNDVTGI